MNTNLRSLAAALALTATGCSLVVDPKAKDPLKTAEGFCNSVQDVLVALVPRCDASGAGEFVQMVERWRVGCDNLGTAVDQGRMGYDRDVAEACLAALEGANCNAVGESILDACALATPGRVPAGAPCYRTGGGSPSDCTPDGTCVSAAACPGTCVIKPTVVGADCKSTNRECGGGLTCSYQPTSSTYVCITPVGVGGSCSSYDNCIEGSYCDLRASPGTCKLIPTTPQPVGGDCYYDGDASCQQGLYCAWNVSYTCQPILAASASCSYPSECGLPTNTCSKAPGAATGSCIRARLLGEACIAGNQECVDGLWCDAAAPGALGTCRGQSAEGGTCGWPFASDTTNARYTEYAACVFGLRCADPTGGAVYPYKGFCAPYLNAGDPCGTSDAACGAPWTGMICDQTLPAPACRQNACVQPFGWLPAF